MKVSTRGDYASRALLSLALHAETDEGGTPTAVRDIAERTGLPHENGACDHEGQCILLDVWADVGEHMRTHLDSFNLADMVARAQGRVPAVRDAAV